MNEITNYLNEVKEICDKLDKNEIQKFVNIIKDLKGRLFIIGVGGSAANASHAANDFRKLCNIEAYAPTDNVAELTARTNDEGWKYVFSEWLKESRLCSKDAILVFSVGGGNAEKQISENIIYALRLAKLVKAKIFGIVGRDGGYTKKVANVCVVIPTVNEYLITPFVESFQAIIWHMLVFHPSLNINAGKWESIALKK